jgi:hypothetical protein
MLNPYSIKYLIPKATDLENFSFLLKFEHLIWNTDLEIDI